MASLKALKMRINSVKSTQKITKAMKMVAAAKLRRAQDAAVASRPYAERLEAVVSSIASKVSVGPIAKAAGWHGQRRCPSVRCRHQRQGPCRCV